VCAHINPVRMPIYRQPSRPPFVTLGDLEVLVTDDEDFVVLSFAIPRDKPRDLSPAESRVAVLVALGRSNAEIAKMRGASVRTVANQVASLFRKLGVHSRLELLTSTPLIENGSQRGTI